ncbi:MAG TPA: glycosyltransferase [Anaerohalosphaeraceae bacterium]|nr:glycosyltransferase [Phycisphaerae bacterium]HOK94822.1 glycosyltransferase [Anaerohalosphaeraceae bacterium]HOL30505.1 glycosyltransferase [Anaerohalosphaeraceae bacterium]HOM75758.1 glycosyltransferase [Anaerohalosphaeraceae bacterium]HPC63951.1 glycosyltransferase [Anaerohalosphaeraceae bacterium]
MVELSIIIPAYNESRKIAGDILAADQFCISSGIAGQIIIVDDGSTDGTADAARTAAAQIRTPCLVEQLKSNRGKGCAVRTGMLKSQGAFAAFADSGCCVPFYKILTALDLIRSGQCQIAHGSRKLSGVHIVRPQSAYRKICSGLFHWFLIHDIKRLANLTDTQCGFKVYQGEAARRIYAQSRIDGFMFDVEIILLALAAGYTIREFPIDWAWDPDSRLKPAREAIRVFCDLLTLKRRFADVLKDSDGRIARAHSPVG